MLANRHIALSVRLFLRSKKYVKSHRRQRIQLSEVGPQMLNAGQSLLSARLPAGGVGGIEIADQCDGSLAAILVQLFGHVNGFFFELRTAEWGSIGQKIR